jgi:hypothetical protein
MFLVIPITGDSQGRSLSDFALRTVQSLFPCSRISAPPIASAMVGCKALQQKEPRQMRGSEFCRLICRPISAPTSEQAPARCPSRTKVPVRSYWAAQVAALSPEQMRTSRSSACSDGKTAARITRSRLPPGILQWRNFISRRKKVFPRWNEHAASRAAVQSKKSDSPKSGCRASCGGRPLLRTASRQTQSVFSTFQKIGGAGAASMPLIYLRQTLTVLYWPSGM